MWPPFPVYVTPFPSEKNQCRSNEFVCDHGLKCFSERHRCNFVNDCRDGSGTGRLFSDLTWIMTPAGHCLTSFWKLQCDSPLLSPNSKPPRVFNTPTSHPRLYPPDFDYNGAVLGGLIPSVSDEYNCDAPKCLDSEFTCIISRTCIPAYRRYLFQ